MPITKSAKKALRNSSKKRLFNKVKKEAINKNIKKLKSFIQKKDAKGATEQMKNVQKILDKSVKTKLIKLNTASRKKSRLVAMIKKIK